MFFLKVIQIFRFSVIYAFLFLISVFFTSEDAFSANYSSKVGEESQIDWEEVRQKLRSSSKDRGDPKALKRSSKGSKYRKRNRKQGQEVSKIKHTQVKGKKKVTLSGYFGLGFVSNVMVDNLNHTSMAAMARLGLEVFINKNVYFALEAYGDVGASVYSISESLWQIGGAFKIGKSFNNNKTNLYMLFVAEHMSNIKLENRYLFLGIGPGFKQAIWKHMKFFLECRAMWNLGAYHNPNELSGYVMNIELVTGIDFSF